VSKTKPKSVERSSRRAGQRPRSVDVKRLEGIAECLVSEAGSQPSGAYKRQLEADAKTVRQAVSLIRQQGRTITRLRKAAESALGRLEWVDGPERSERAWIEELEKALK
jgi:hypothetical protein